jgi:hypothetical protein
VRVFADRDRHPLSVRLVDGYLQSRNVLRRTVL